MVEQGAGLVEEIELDDQLAKCFQGYSPRLLESLQGGGRYSRQLGECPPAVPFIQPS